MQGVYLVFFHLAETEEIEIGALGELDFQNGVYVYTGSAQNSVEKRINRHFNSTTKKHWHIDYFSQEAEPIDNFVLPENSSYECWMAKKLNEWGEPVDGFGSSDCACSSHLFRLEPESF